MGCLSHRKNGISRRCPPWNLLRIGSHLLIQIIPQLTQLRSLRMSLSCLEPMSPLFMIKLIFFQLILLWQLHLQVITDNHK
jgi:hypothetical protein